MRIFLALVSWAALLGTSTVSFAAGTSFVGNGDSGQDLEGWTLVTKGPLIGSRKEALETLQRVNVDGIPGLGDLRPEVSNAELFLARKDVTVILPGDTGHADISGKVFARTFPRSHASTRFFPVALKLSTDQLVSLHIHEALHRALPEEIREDESKVSQPTLAISSPGATHDRVREAAAQVMPPSILEKDRLLMSAAAVDEKISTAEVSTAVENVPERYPSPSSVGYTVENFLAPEKESAFPVERVHSFHGFLFPFGQKNNAVGMGIEASMIQRDGKFSSGPLGISGRARVWTVRDFDVHLHGTAFLNTLSSEELKSSPLGRDVITLGASMDKVNGLVYASGKLAYTIESEATQKIHVMEYRHQYGWVVDAGLRAGVALWSFRLGAHGDYMLGDNYKVSGGAFRYESGRYRIVSGGPEASWESERLRITARGRFLTDSTRGANFDFLGNLLGAGVAQGGISASVSVFL